MPRPELSMVEIPANVAMFTKDRRSYVQRDIDARYRKTLLAAVTADGGRKARWHVNAALENGPSSEGAAETIRFFGDELSEKLQLTAQIVDGLEIAAPGLKKWLEMTGFGNDCRMVRGFVAWAEHKAGVGRVITEASQVFHG
jgi:hypothetical protein